MSRHQRVARDAAEPPPGGPAGAQRWSDYLDWVRAALASAVLELPEPERRRSRLASGWTPIELLSHVLHMEQRWFVWGFLGERVESPWGDWNIPEPWDADDSDATRPGARWVVPEDITAEDLAARLGAVGERTRVILRDHTLEEPGASGGRFGADPPSLEWICFHVLAEYARHAGHLDIVVELGAQLRASQSS